MNSSPVSFRRATVLGTLLVWLGGCTVGPDFVRPVPPVAARFTAEPLPAATVLADGQSQQFQSGRAVSADWWRLFGSARLDALVQQAIANNFTLQGAEASLRQSRESLRAGYGVFYPQIEGDVAASRQRTAAAESGSPAPGHVFNLVTASGTVSYAIDVFGGSRRTVESLRAQADYQLYEFQAAWLTLTANVVNTAIARAAYGAERRAIRQLIMLEQQQLEFIEVQVRAGTAGYATGLSQRSLIAANQARLAPLAQSVSQTEHLLATLEGVEPALAVWPEVDLTDLTLPTDLPVSLPAEFVRERPDILAAEAEMHAASAKIGVATATMYPSLNLSGTYGTAGSSFGKLSALAAATGQFWSIGPSVTVPVFQGTSLWFGRKAAMAAYQQSLAAYRQTVLVALAQVADTLQALEHDAEALRAQTDARHAAGEALTLVQANYRAGLVAYGDVLTADVQFHQATIGWLQAVAQRQQDTVGLYVALGGGWRNATAPAVKGVNP